MIYIEYLIITIIVAAQAYLAYRTWQKIDLLGTLFNNDIPEVKLVKLPSTLVKSGSKEEVSDFILRNLDVTEGEVVEVAHISYFAKTEVEYSVIDTVNTYLLKNKGAIADYHLLKDIVDRNVDSLDEEIHNSLPAPLYFGLAATMLGIIFGLISMPSFDVTADGSFNLNALEPLLHGVQVAMFASVFGLILTTVLSIFFYKPAKTRSEKYKNSFLSFLQANLLPELIRTETSGISALNDRLQNFGRTLAPNIKELAQVVDRSIDAVRIQQNTIRRVEELGTTQLAKSNASIFKELSGMMDSFKEFAAYYQELTKSVKQTSDLTQNLKGLVQRTNEVERIASGIESNVQQNNALGKYLSKHFVDVESQNTALKSVVDESSITLNKSLEEVKATAYRLAEEMQGISISMEPKLKEAFDSSLLTIEKMTSEQLSKLEMAYENSRPKFDKLERLDKIEEGIDKLNQTSSEQSKQQAEIAAALQELAEVLRENKAKGNDSGMSDEGKALSQDNEDDEPENKENSETWKTALLAVNATGSVVLIGFLIYGYFTGLF